MADWQRTIRLNPEWSQAKENEISVQELARSIVGRLKMVADFSRDRMTDPNEIDDERDEIIGRFQELAADPLADVSMLDGVMRDLYDWGDTQIGYSATFHNMKKVCWVDTISRAPSRGCSEGRSTP